MSTAKKAPARPGRAGKGPKAPELVNHRDVATRLGITTQNIRRWVASGEFPEPHSVLASLWFYREDHVRAFLETGKWPDGAKFKRRGGGEE